MVDWAQKRAKEIVMAIPSKEAIEAVAKAYSGAPFPSKQSLTRAKASILAYHAYLEAEGMVIVLREPTVEMVEHGRAADDSWCDGEYCDHHPPNIAEIYKAMTAVGRGKR